MEMYGLPGCSRDTEYFEFEVSTVSALSVCFCCLASNTPVINAITCTHTEFVHQYFTEWNNQKLAICYTCHYMLKKIEVFRRQVHESLKLLGDYQHTKAHRPRLVNNLVTTDIVVTSNVTSIEPTYEVIPIEIDVDEKPSMSNQVVEDSDDEPTEKIEVASDLLQPVSVVLKGNGKPRKKYKKTYFTTKKQRTQSIQWYAKQKQSQTQFKREKSQKNNTPTNSITEKPTTSELHVLSNFITENLMKSNKIVSTTNSPTKKSRQAKTKELQTEKKGIQTKIQKSFWLAHEIVRLRNEPKKPKRILPTKMQITNVELFSMKEYFHILLDKKYDGRIKVIYLNQEELMAEREAEKLKEFYLKKPYKCETCIQGFTDEARYNNHMSKNHPFERTDYETSCEVCDTVIKTQRGIRRHLKDHVLRYVCVACGKKSRHLDSTESHYKFTHSERIKCKDCNKAFGTMKNLRLHRRQEHKKECKYCQRGFLKYIDLQNHYRRSHPGESPLKCELCHEAFKNTSELYRHKHLIHKIIKKHYNRRNRIKGTENIDQNIIVIKNSEHDSDEAENNEHDDTIDLEKSENTGHNNIADEPEVYVPPENNEPQIYVLVNHDHEEENVIKDCNVIKMENNEHNVVEVENNYHEEGVGENYLDNMVGEIEYNILEGKEDQSCIIGL